MMVFTIYFNFFITYYGLSFVYTVPQINTLPMTENKSLWSMVIGFINDRNGFESAIFVRAYNENKKIVNFIVT